MSSQSGIKIITKNRKARHNYDIGDTYEAGLVLMGSEIKSIRANRVNIGEGFVEDRGGELWLMGVHINTYEQAGAFGHTDPTRPRKLLLHKKEIAEIMDWIRDKGNTAVPTMLYLKRGRAKIEVGMARGKKLYDKRQAIAKRDADKQMRRVLKGQYE